jgi:hypothetical protein
MTITILLSSLSIFGAGVGVCTAAANQNYPRAVMLNGQYYVIWADTRHGSNYAVYGSRVKLDGKVLDPDGKQLFKHLAAYQPALATDGRALIAVFRDGC